MGFLGELFDDAIEIASTPVKFVAKLTDDIAETEIKDWVDDVVDSVKTKDKD